MSVSPGTASGVPHSAPLEADHRRLRILFYNHTGLASGAERVLLDTLSSLDRTLFTPLVACPSEGTLQALLAEQDIPVLTAPRLEARFTTSPGMLVHYLRSFAAAIADLRSLIAHTAPGVVHANSVRAGIVATLATIGTDTPIVWHVHDDLPPHPISTVIRLAAFLSPRTSLLAVSNATAAAFRGHFSFAGRLHVLYTGVDLDRYPAKTSTASAFREELGLAPGDLLLSAVGMISARKGLAPLLDAFKTVSEALPHVHLAIVGAPIFNRDDLYLAELQQQSKSLNLEHRVHFTGPRNDGPAIFRASDLVLLNALVEPFGLVLIEAMSSGTAVLASRVGGIPEIVTDNRTGFLVAPGDSAALAARLLAVLADPASRERAAAAALTEVCPRFSKRLYSENFADFYRHRFPRSSPSPSADASSPVRSHAVS